MLRADADSLKELIKNKQWEALQTGEGINYAIDVKSELLRMFPQLFTKKGLCLNADKTVSEREYIEFGKWSLNDVVEKIKENRLDLKI